jgi:regulator of protease activity HflC (stomatin/prohibitin superfamily)
MFDKLIDWLISIWGQLIPYVIVNQMDNGIRLRFGKFKNILLPGIHFKIPFFDEVLHQGIVWTTHSMPSQSLTTKDSKDVVVKGIIKYRIVDIQTFALEVWDAIDAISDMTQGIIFDIVKDKTWDELQTIDLKPLITRKARLEAKRWGIEIETVTLSDLAKIRSIRLLNDNGSIG